MNDKRLIDANVLMRDVMGLTIVSPEAMNYANAVAVAIANATTIDAVEVVRCRECIHHVRTKSNLGFSWCGKFGNVMRDSDFCSWGERKMDGGAEGV